MIADAVGLLQVDPTPLTEGKLTASNQVRYHQPRWPSS